MASIPNDLSGVDPQIAQWFRGLTKAQQKKFLAKAAQRAETVAMSTKALAAPSHWREWITTVAPNTYKDNFADHHVAFWEWIESLEAGKPPKEAFFLILARGGGKTSSIEGGIVRAGALGKRRFALYVRAKQEKADESIRSISSLIQGSVIERYYPRFASRKVDKYGQSQGWTMERLRCANGFNVLGVGLDSANRGVKFDELRPDLIIFDDIDDNTDSELTIRKKIAAITKAILPAGSADVAVCGAQNLIHADGIFTSIANGTADFLYNRKVVGPVPAIEGLEVQEKASGGFRITGGTPTWAGQSIEIANKQINDWGYSAFLQEAQHDVQDPLGGRWDHIIFRKLSSEEYERLDIIDQTMWVDPAVTDTDNSDSQAIQAAAIDKKKHIYMTYSYEKRGSPLETIMIAIVKALEMGIARIGIETDQGGDTWDSVYREAISELIDSSKYPDITRETRFPRFVSAKAGSIGSKRGRNEQMLSDYEKGQVSHVIGTSIVLEKGLRRFPAKKPFDVVDAAFWCWHDLRDGVYAPPKTQAKAKSFNKVKQELGY